MVEFFIDKTNETDIIINNDGQFSVLDESHPMVPKLFDTIKENYSEAYQALDSIYGKAAFFKFLFVRRFLKCNFSKHDEKPDIDQNGFFQIESVSCPLLGECKHEGLICNAKVNRILSDREIEVLKLIASGHTDYQVADKLFIAINTAKNHRKNILHKTGSTNTAQLVSYANEHQLI